LVLWIVIAALGVITSMAHIASWTRSDCYSPNSSTPNNADTECTDLERVSSAVYHHSSYLQSLHIILPEAIATFTLLVFEPTLWSMV
jgi:hypothetical protein